MRKCLLYCTAISKLPDLIPLAFCQTESSVCLTDPRQDPFWDHIFRNIDELIFAPLFSEKPIPDRTRQSMSLSVPSSSKNLPDWRMTRSWNPVSSTCVSSTHCIQPASKISHLATGHSADFVPDVLHMNSRPAWIWSINVWLPLRKTSVKKAGKEYRSTDHRLFRKETQRYPCRFSAILNNYGDIIAHLW